ncbi:MAG: hypothetical protein WB711_18870, partial [Terriglobales bacterium]
RKSRGETLKVAAKETQPLWGRAFLLAIVCNFNLAAIVAGGKLFLRQRLNLAMSDGCPSGGGHISPSDERFLPYLVPGSNASGTLFLLAVQRNHDI